MTVLHPLANTTLIVTPLIILLLLLVPILDKKFASRGRYILWLMITASLILPLFTFIPRPVLRVEMPLPASTVQTRQTPMPEPGLEPERANNLTPSLPDNHTQSNETPASGASAGIVVIRPGPIPEYTASSSRLSNVTVEQIILFVWLMGLIIYSVYHAFSYISFKRFVKRWQIPEANPHVLRMLDVTKGYMDISSRIGIARCKGINAPVLMGFVNPTILLPDNEYDEEDLDFIFRHELIHFIRRDLLYKLALVVVKCIYWFNPAVHLMARQANKDIEIICDGLTVNNLGLESRKRYSEIILSMASGPRQYQSHLTTHFNGGNKMLKHRFGNILGKAKKSGALLFIMVGGAIFASGLFVGISFASEPAEAFITEPPPLEAYSREQLSPTPPAISTLPALPRHPDLPALPDLPSLPSLPFNSSNASEEMYSTEEFFERTLDEGTENNERAARNRINPFNNWEIRYYEDIDLLHSMVFDKPRLAEHVFYQADSLNIDLISDNIIITTGGDRLVIRYYEWVENLFTVDNAGGTISLIPGGPHHRFNVNATDTRNKIMSGFTTDGYFYDRNWLPRYLEANGKPTITTIEIIIPENMTLGTTRINTFNGDIIISGISVRDDTDISTMNGQIRLTDGSFGPVDLSSMGGEIIVSGSDFSGIANLSTFSGLLQAENTVFNRIVNFSSTSGAINSINSRFNNAANFSVHNGNGRIVLTESANQYDIHFSRIRGELRHNGVSINSDTLQNPNGTWRINLSGFSAGFEIYDNGA